MLVFDQLMIRDRGNATYDPGAALTSGAQNVVTTRLDLAATRYSRMVTLNWVCNPGTGTGGLVDGAGNPLWSTTMPTARANLKSWLNAAGAGTQPSGFVVDAQYNFFNPYDVCTQLWGYKGINVNSSGPEITEAAWARACDLCRQNAWLLYDFVTAVRSIYPKKPVGLYMLNGDSQSYNRWYADMNYTTYRSAYPAGRKWQARGQEFTRQFFGWFDFLSPSCYTFTTGVSWVSYCTDPTGTHSTSNPVDPLYGTGAGWSPKHKWQSIVSRDCRFARSSGLPIIPFISPCYHPSVNLAAYNAGVTMHADVVSDQLRFMQEDMDVLGVVLWDTHYARAAGDGSTWATTSPQDVTLYNTNGIWAAIDAYAAGGSEYVDKLATFGTSGVWTL